MSRPRVRVFDWLWLGGGWQWRGAVGTGVTALSWRFEWCHGHVATARGSGVRRVGGMHAIWAFFLEAVDTRVFKWLWLGGGWQWRGTVGTGVTALSWRFEWYHCHFATAMGSGV
jgi:hypothetical protein